MYDCEYLKNGKWHSVMIETREHMTLWLEWAAENTDVYSFAFGPRWTPLKEVNN